MTLSHRPSEAGAVARADQMPQRTSGELCVRGETEKNAKPQNACGGAGRCFWKYISLNSLAPESPTQSAGTSETY